MTCPKCPSPSWCHTHSACGREVRARWMMGRRSGFRDRVWLDGEVEQPKHNETDSQFQARMRDNKEVLHRGKHT